MDMNSLSHTKWNCKYYIVFAPHISKKDSVCVWSIKARYCKYIERVM